MNTAVESRGSRYVNHSEIAPVWLAFLCCTSPGQSHILQIGRQNQSLCVVRAELFPPLQTYLCGSTTALAHVTSTSSGLRVYNSCKLLLPLLLRSGSTGTCNSSASVVVSHGIEFKLHVARYNTVVSDEPSSGLSNRHVAKL